jgi:hypothetical protein
MDFAGYVAVCTHTNFAFNEQDYTLSGRHVRFPVRFIS